MTANITFARAAISCAGTTEPTAMAVVRGKKTVAVSYERFLYLGSKSDRMREACARYVRQMSSHNYGNFLRDCVSVLLPKSQQELALALIGAANPNKEASLSAMRVMLAVVEPKLAEGKLKGEKLLFAELLREVYRASTAKQAAADTVIEA